MNYQKTMLQAMLDGKTFSCPRMCGRRILLEGYYNYLKSIHEEHRKFEDAEVHINIIDVTNEHKQKRFAIIDEEAFKQEYECKWVK
jgi:hypothetical protein